jgi:hypothetical protein
VVAYARRTSPRDRAGCIDEAAGATRDGCGGGELIVGVAKSIWASVQGDPVFMRRVNGWLTVFWVLMIPVSLATGWVKSVVYVSALSLWALVSGHWSAWQAARVEVNQANEMRAREEEDIAGAVVDRVIAETDVRAVDDAAAFAERKVVAE